jgi:hypothetical protein
MLEKSERERRLSLAEAPRLNRKANSFHPNEIVPLLREFHRAGGAGRDHREGKKYVILKTL